MAENGKKWQKIKYNRKKETQIIIVHDREPPDSPSRQQSKMSHLKRKNTPEKRQKQKTSSEKQAKNKKSQFIRYKDLKFIIMAWNLT